MNKGDIVKLNKKYINQMGYPYSELAKLRYFTVLELPDKFGVVRLSRGDLASHRIERYHESFLELV